MIFKNLFVLCFLLITGLTLKAQSGSVCGKLINDSNRAVPYHEIWLRGTSYRTFSNEKGYFQIRNVKPGNYTLICAGLNIDTTETTVSIQDGENPYTLVQAKESLHKLKEVVITATRTEKELTDVPIPLKVISGEQIRQMGSMRLNEVLSEQTGLAIVTDHGTGIQMQGFAPEYTLILINGEPLIGRTAGTFDLTRIAVGNIKQIEIVKGASSSLYGSEALAGVINIITEKPKEKFSANLKTKYASNNTLGISGDANVNIGKLGIYLFADRYTTSGYYLGSSEDKVVPPYQNHTFQNGITYKFNARTQLSLTGRLSFQDQTSTYNISESNQDTYKISDAGRQKDWNINPTLTYCLNEKDKLTAKFYSSRYHTNSTMTKVSDGSLYDESYFTQTFSQPEIQYNRYWNSKNETFIGIGSTLESVNASRYTSMKNFYNLYIYAQHDFTILKKLNIIAGIRADRHSVYGTQINPKLSAKFKLSEKISFRGSVGRGFKAPDFRQLYLNFSNPIEGYSVLGSEEVKYQFDKMNQQGLIDEILIDPYSLQAIKAENAMAYNIGWVVQPTSKITWQTNFFRNDISDMIATAPMAIKTNGQSVFSYFNLSKVYTQGIETDLSYKILKNTTLYIGYQYLIAKDKQVVNDVEQGLYFRKDPDTWQTTRVTKKEYGGLFNRSKHMANIRLFYSNPENGWGFNIRGTYRGKYGYGDANGNLILDTDNEYIKGYWLWNIAVNKRVFKNITLQVGIDNVGDYTKPLYIPSIPGRILYGSLNIPITKETLKSNNK